MSLEIERINLARSGSAEAFSALVEPYRRQLTVHCYRLSGSLDDAEDIVQEAFLRAWEKLKTFRGEGSFRNWLYMIATRLWVDEIRRRGKQVLLPLDGAPAAPNAPPKPPGEPAAWLDPWPDAWLLGSDPSAESAYEQREAISLAFMVALQKLNVPQRVVLLLRSVYNFPAEEVAAVLGVTTASIHNHLYRARQTLENAPLIETPISNGEMDRFMAAWEAADIDVLIDLLHEEATFAMPPMGVWYAGRAAIGQALSNFVFTPGVAWKCAVTRANGRPACAIYRQAGDDPAYHPFAILLPACDTPGGGIRALTAYLAPGLFERFGLGGG